MISRRRLLHITASFIPIALLAGLAGGVSAQQKSPKEAVNYQDQPKNDQKCSQCRFFTEPDGCQVVEGTISPEGWCSLFQPDA